VPPYQPKKRKKERGGGTYLPHAVPKKGGRYLGQSLFHRQREKCQGDSSSRRRITRRKRRVKEKGSGRLKIERRKGKSWCTSLTRTRGIKKKERLTLLESAGLACDDTEARAKRGKKTPIPWTDQAGGTGRLVNPQKGGNSSHVTEKRERGRDLS